MGHVDAAARGVSRKKLADCTGQEWSGDPWSGQTQTALRTSLPPTSLHDLIMEKKGAAKGLPVAVGKPICKKKNPRSGWTWGR